MLIDLLVVLVLGLFLWWPHRREPGFIKKAFAPIGAGLAQFWRGFVKSRFGVVVLLLGTMSLVGWSHAVSVSGLEALNPAFHTGELTEQRRCFDYQTQMRELGVGTYAPSELVCPSSGARLTNPGTPQSSCPVHGAPP